MWSRIHLIPALTAEEDRDLVRRHFADQKREKELLGASSSPYNSDKYASVLGAGEMLTLVADMSGLRLPLRRRISQSR